MQKLARFNGIMYRGRCVISKKKLLRFYLAYVVPIISYGLLIHGSDSRTNLEKVYLFQYRILRTIFFKRKFEHITSKFNELGSETVHEIYSNQLFKETIFQYLKLSPLDYLKINKFSYRRSTRFTSNGMITFYRCKTKMMETYKTSHAYKNVECFNFLMSNRLLPDNIGTYSDEKLSNFKKKFQGSLH